MCGLPLTDRSGGADRRAGLVARRPVVAVELRGVELARAGQLILHKECEVANEKCRGGDQLSNNNEIHNRSFTTVLRRAQFTYWQWRLPDSPHGFHSELQRRRIASLNCDGVPL